MSRIGKASEVKQYKNGIKKGASQIVITGEVVLGKEPFSMDNNSNGYVWSKTNIGIDTKTDGIIYADLNGGYGTQYDNKIYVHGVQEKDGQRRDDFQNRWEIAWEDRHTEALFDEIGDRCFITVGIERDKEGKVFYKKFLSEYDAVGYLSKNLEQGMKVRIRADLSYQKWEGKVTKRKSIRSIYLVEVDESSYGATFEQAIYIDKNATDFRADKETGEIFVSAMVPDYVNKPKVNGVKQPIKGNVLYPVQFVMDTKNEKAGLLAKKIFDAQGKEVWMLTVEGRITKAGSTVQVTTDVLTDDIKELIEYGALTEEEALEKVVGKTSKTEKWVITAPKIRKTADGKPYADIDKKTYTTDIMTHTYEHMLASIGVSDDVPEDVDDIMDLLG